MTTVTTLHAGPALDLSQSTPVPLARLVRVELRKALDTRAGRWLIGVLAGLVLLAEVVVVLVTPDDSDINFSDLLGLAGFVLGYFLPILVIMQVTAEASQRTGLVTFTLEPRRPRIVVAKFAAGLILAVAVLALAAAIAVAATLLAAATGASPTWSVELAVIGYGFLLSNVFGVFSGFAIAMLLMNTPAAIVTYFAYSLILPVAVGVLSSLSSGFEKVAPWTEFRTAQNALFEDGGPSLEQWGQIASSGVLWLGLPLALGVARLLRTEFK